MVLIKLMFMAGTVCWTMQLVPQVWKSWREKSTHGLSPWLVCVVCAHRHPLQVLTRTHRLQSYLGHIIRVPWRIHHPARY
jgi:hypothetical protein